MRKSLKTGRRQRGRLYSPPAMLSVFTFTALKCLQQIKVNQTKSQAEGKL